MTLSNFALSVLKNVQKQNRVPLFGNAEDFDLSLFCSRFKEKIHAEEFECTLKERSWKEPKEFLRGLGVKPSITSICISPLSSSIYWIMPKKDKSQLVHEIGTHQVKKKIFSSSILEEGYFRFLILETLSCLQTLDPIQQMSLHLNEEEDLPKETAFSIDIDISLKETTCWGRLLISQSFQKEWIQHFSAFPLEYASKLATRNMDCKMSLKIGSVSLSIQEIKKLKPLDILIPDHISYIPDDQESTGLLMFGSTPLFVTKIVNNQIQIVDSMTHFEESMKENISNPEETLLKKFDTDTEEAVSIKEVPLEITVELARFTMPLKELLQLKAGNVLELPHHAEQRISLSLNGKKIGHGELVTLGDLLAIKIIDL